ncbi:asparagine synthase [Halorubrum ezzemoulense]|uniref:Asparagine synthase n=2 Tax=Halorubrum ezzemoulense TaxID=337243 RepID=A0A256ITP5_HALEZ|nr:MULTISPECIES: asparagine synthase-related protein [Halorubrum]OSO97698.1 asparagine synthase [Halorubrum ezzemoulense DSM 17463]OYR59918.1 asparagine synthase [Halorubrum ezzemoulense]OYR64914.1 asparagine synthase [Halorubrum ezzemoulense]TKX61490.1 asparagine synthetase B [Halorubrum sp. GN12_10-3_MGM]
MTAPSSSDLRGAPADRVRAALRDGDPLPGGCGFAGLLAEPPSLDPRDRDGPNRDGPVLVRDVLGRQPLFVEREALDPGTARIPAATDAWAFDRGALADPEPVPAGSVVSAGGTERVWRLPDPAPTADPEAALAAVDGAVSAALEDLAASTRSGGDDESSDGNLAVAFSGGVDSGLVAAAVPEAPCYVAGFEGSHDIAAAREAASAMDRDLRVVEVTHDDLTRAVRAVAAATGRRNPMDASIAVPLFMTAEAAAADGFDRLAVGQGADELFGGYSKVVDPAEDSRVDADTVRGARTETVRTLPDQLERDVLALRAAGVEPATPLLDDRVVGAALALPDALLVDGDERKVALRRVASRRLPESVHAAEKKAVQYGTYVSRELDRLARQAGYKRRMDDHVGKYVEALCSEEKPAGEGRD